MKNDFGVSTISDSDLEDHIKDLESQLTKLHINLLLATEERSRRTQSRPTKLEDKPPRSISDSTRSLSIEKTPALYLGATVRIRNRYRGNKGKVGKIIQISSKTATVHIPNEGNFIKYLHNLELLTTS